MRFTDMFNKIITKESESTNNIEQNDNNISNKSDDLTAPFDDGIDYEIGNK